MEVNLGEQVNHRDGDPLMSCPFAPHRYEMLRAPQQDPYVSNQHRAVKPLGHHDRPLVGRSQSPQGQIG